MRTADVIAKDLHDLTWNNILQEHQQATHPHPVTVAGMKRNLIEMKKAWDEMWQAVEQMEKVEVQA